ncbi:MAG: ABC transporter permease [Acidimicrobiia bacterium]|nr:ABC transporter permease [Acidimicrobiia bacterium]
MIWTIAQRELVTRLRSRALQAITGIMLFGVIGLVVALSFFNPSDDKREVTVGLTGSGTDLAAALEVGTDLLDVTTLPVDLAGTTGPGGEDEAIETALADGDVDVVFDGRSVVWEGATDSVLDRHIRDVVQQQAVVARAADRGLTGEDLAQVFAPVDIEGVRLDGGDDQQEIRLVAAGASAFATFMLLQIWGSFLMMGVIEEKSSKVVEILLSHVRPSTLLSGKVLGLGILAVGQMLIVVMAMVIGLTLVRDVEIPSAVWGTIPLFVVTFLAGFAFYAVAFATVGSMVSRQEDAQSAQLPAMLPLLSGYFIAAFSLTSPGNLAVTIGSFVPFTSPVLLPFRTATTDMPVWQIALSLMILAGSSVVMLQLAGQIYRYSILRSGTRVSFAEAWRNRSEDAL